ncbi:APC family permease [Rhizohabitans arisaemae]|uniref:APC family permease n=1 Tax=Rhizohabitans arisaemae TaxID=2720610 RepID=UPI0024B1C429|nr:amino acid permease [Rhizohabitans arisaemae]
MGESRGDPARDEAGPEDAPDPPGGRLGLPAATALVAGNIVGTGIFLLPAALAEFGIVGIVAFGLVTIGALTLALVFGTLGRRIPRAGGPYVYAREAFGEFPGFLTAWSFWITSWAGNAGIAYAWTGYVVYFLEGRSLFGLSWTGTTGQIVIGLIGIWLVALINLTGVKNMGRFQVVTVVLKFAPLLFVTVVGLFSIRMGNFGPFNATGQSVLVAVSAAAALVLFAYSGLESATVAAEKVADPRRDIGRAGFYGCLACAVLYLLSTIAIFGTVPHEELINSKTPFTDAVENMFGVGIWGGVIAACAVVSGIGALNGWTMLVAEMPMAAARDGLFPRVFTRMNPRNVPYVGVIVASVLTSLTLVLAYGATNAFDTILLLATFTTVIPYLFSTGARIFWLATGRREIALRGFAWEMTIAAVAMVFSYWMVVGAGGDAVFRGTLMLLLGIPVYVWIKVARGGYGAPATNRDPS